MKVNYRLYGGPLDGLDVESVIIEEGWEVEFDTAIQFTDKDGVLTKDGRLSATYTMCNGELTHKDLLK